LSEAHRKGIGEKLIKMWPEFTERVLTFQKPKWDSVMEAAKKYRKLKVQIIEDADIRDSLESLKQSYLKVGLTERCLSEVKTVSGLLDVLELQLIIDLEEASFIYLNRLVKQSKNKDLKDKVKALSMTEICRESRNTDFLPWAESWAAQPLPIQLKGYIRKNIAKEVADATGTWSDCRRFLEYLGLNVKSEDHRAKYSDSLREEVYKSERKNWERVELGLESFEETANHAGMLANAGQLQQYIVNSMRNCGLMRAANNVLLSI